MARMLLFLFLLLHAFGGAPAAESDPLDSAFQRGVDAYRSGAYAEAETVWTTLLESGDLSDEARAAVCYDLGNVAWREDRRNEAVGWYTAAIRLSPRHADAWRNLEYVRGVLGIEPHDRGDLGSTFRRLVTSLRPAERRNLALFALVLAAAVLVLETLFGGASLRRLAIATALLAALALVPWIAGLASSEHDPYLVVAERSPKLRSEPSADSVAVAELAPGETVERIDELPGWLRVQGSDARRGWVAESALFRLVR